MMETIVHSCGHGERVRILGDTPEERDAKRERIRSRRCVECRVADDRAATGTTPFETGSDAQIAWAADIRRSLLSRFDVAVAKAQARGEGGKARVFRGMRRNIARWRDAARLVTLRDAWDVFLDDYSPKEG